MQLSSMHEKIKYVSKNGTAEFFLITVYWSLFKNISSWFENIIIALIP